MAEMTPSSKKGWGMMGTFMPKSDFQYLPKRDCLGLNCCKLLIGLNM